jgi:hypothetical protein
MVFKKIANTIASPFKMLDDKVTGGKIRKTGSDIGRSISKRLPKSPFRQKSRSSQRRRKRGLSRSTGSRRKMNVFFQQMLKAKRSGKKSFEYKGRTYSRRTKVNPKNGVEIIYYKAPGRSRSPSKSRASR